MNREILVEVDSSSWSPGTPPSTLVGGNQILNILDVFLHVAMRTSHPISYGFALSDLWACLRYLPAISTDHQLRLRPEWDDLDPHQKTILSDDWGMGFSSVILSSALDLLFVCPTTYLISRFPSITLGSAGGKRGPKKSPDFIGIDKHLKLHIFECKGTQSNSDQLLKQLRDGVPQKRNVIAPSGLIGECLVSGLFVPQHTSTEEALFMIIDPEIKIDLTKIDEEVILCSIILGEIASSIHLLGFPKIANAVAKAISLEQKMIDRVNKDIDELRTFQFEGKEFVYQEVIHRFDYEGNDEIYGLKLTIGFDKFLLASLMGRDVNINLILQNILEKIREKQFDRQTKNNSEDSRTLLTASGLFLKLEVIY